MGSKRARTAAFSPRALKLWVGLGVLTSVIALWAYKRDYQARQQVRAAEREARLAALRAEAEAQRREVEQRAVRVKSAERVGQLYREIENLSQMGDRVQTALQHRPRMLKTNEAQSQATP